MGSFGAERETEISVKSERNCPFCWIAFCLFLFWRVFVGFLAWIQQFKEFGRGISQFKSYNLLWSLSNVNNRKSSSRNTATAQVRSNSPVLFSFSLSSFILRTASFWQFLLSAHPSVSVSVCLMTMMCCFQPWGGVSVWSSAYNGWNGSQHVCAAAARIFGAGIGRLEGLEIASPSPLRLLNSLIHLADHLLIIYIHLPYLFINYF